MVRKLLFSYFLLLFSSHNTYALKNDELETFSKSIERTIANHNIPGAIIGVVSDKKVVYEKIYGKKSPKIAGDLPNNRVNRNTIFRVASVSKFFTGLLLEILSHQGKISLEDSIVHYLPELKKIEHQKLYKLKVRNIINHTSGLMPYFMVDYENNTKSTSLSILVNRINRETKVFFPGTFHAYQNIFFNLIAHYIKAKLKINYTDSFNKYLMKPLKITNFTLFNQDFTNHTNKAIPAICVKSLPKKVYMNYASLGNYDNIMSAGGLAMSFSASASVFMALLSGSKPFHKDVLQNICRNNVHSCGPSKPCARKNCLCKHRIDTFYGSGCRAATINGIKVYFHFGALRGVSSVIAIIPEKKLALFAYTNASTSAVSEIFAAFCKMNCGSYLKYNASQYTCKPLGIVRKKKKSVSRNNINFTKKEKFTVGKKSNIQKKISNVGTKKFVVKVKNLQTTKKKTTQVLVAKSKVTKTNSLKTIKKEKRKNHSKEKHVTSNKD